MVIMNEPQVWVLIGVFAAVMVGGFTLTTTLMIYAMNSGFKAADARFEAVDAKFEKVYDKIDHLDRDVTAISRKAFGIPGE